MRQRGQATSEWIGLIFILALLMAGVVAVGARVSGIELARAVASRLLCAAALADRCGDEPVLIATYGSEVGRLVREQMPSLLFERGARALPVDFRRCRAIDCSDGSARGLVDRSDAGLPITAFVRVVNCRRGTDGISLCSGPSDGNLYLQYWMYYPDSATMRGVPVVGPVGFHEDDWESVQIRIGPDGRVDQRASSHHGYNHLRSVANLGSDAGANLARDAAEAVGARPRNGWGPASGLLLVSGGSHAGNSGGFQHVDRLVPSGRVHLVPLEPIVAGERDDYRFAVSPPWRKRVWSNPEAAGTD